MTVINDRLLTADEEIELAKRIERGDLVAKQEMIERNLRLVLLGRTEVHRPGDVVR
jgi:RNA polymerase primary sigma factor